MPEILIIGLVFFMGCASLTMLALFALIMRDIFRG